MIAQVKLCRDDGTVLTKSLVHGPNPGGYTFPLDHGVVEDDVLYDGFELTFKYKARGERTP